MSDWRTSRDLAPGLLEAAARKVRAGDIRGARVRVEHVLSVLREVERDHCNDCGMLREDDDEAPR